MACVEHRADNICALKCTDAEALRIIGIQTNQQRDPADRSMEDRDSKVSRLGPVDLVFARVEFAELADQTIRPCQDRGIIEVRSIPFNKGTGDINTMLACFFQKKLRSPSVGDCFGYGVCLCTGIKGRAGCKKQLETGSTAQIDVSKLEAEKVTLPVSAVNNVLDLKVEALSIKTADAVVTLDKTAMQSVIEMANGADIQLHVSTAQPSEAQRKLIGTTGQCKVLDVSLTVNGEEVHDLHGNATVSIPFAWETVGALQAWYLADANKKEAIDVAYRDGNAVLTLSHFSTYAVTVTDAPNDTIVRVGATSVTVNAPEGDSCVAALFSADGRQLAVGQATVNQGEETTVTWGAVNSAEVLTLKLFWLDANGAPASRAPSVLVKVSAR